MGEKAEYGLRTIKIRGEIPAPEVLGLYLGDLDITATEAALAAMVHELTAGNQIILWQDPPVWVVMANRVPRDATYPFPPWRRTQPPPEVQASKKMVAELATPTTKKKVANLDQHMASLFSQLPNYKRKPRP